MNGAGCRKRIAAEPVAPPPGGVKKWVIVVLACLSFAGLLVVVAGLLLFA